MVGAAQAEDTKVLQMSFYRIGTPKRALAGVAIMLAIPAAAQESRVTPAGRQPVIIPCMGAAPPPEARCAPVEERLRVNERSRRIPQTIAPQEAFAPLPRDDGMIPAHMRVQGASGRNR